MKKASILVSFLAASCLVGCTPLAPKPANGLEPSPEEPNEFKPVYGDITAVIAGRGLDGGGTRGDVRLDIKVPLSLQGSRDAGGIVSAVNSGSGPGVRGSGSTGVFGLASGPEGIGISARATARSGINYAVYGKTSSKEGYAAYFDGGRNYFGGDVGIGTRDPSSKLDVKGLITALGLEGGEEELLVLSRGDIQFTIDSDDSEFDVGRFVLYSGERATIWSVDEKGNMLLDGYMTIEGNMTVEGATATDVLVITGGSDIAEPFFVSDCNDLPQGALVVIDKENPGRLKLSNCPYDSCVAGVVSGAGGLNPGLVLGQKGVTDSGVNVALNGRVYTLADASNAAIKPGDMLTTSSVPGHAMKATDRERSHGAVIGKAISSLDEGRGLVLVLVNLQ